MPKIETARLCIRLLAVLVLSVLVLGYGEQIVEASQYSDINNCYNAFDNRINTCGNTQSTCLSGCSSQCTGLTGTAWQNCMDACAEACDDNWAWCFSNALTGQPLQQSLSDCLINEVSFSLDMCPLAEQAVDVCNAGRDNCLGVWETVTDPEAAEEIFNGCFDNHWDCVSQSGISECQ